MFGADGAALQNAGGDAILTVNGLQKAFGGVQALSGMDLEVRRGTVTGLIGPNGAGKSTLFNCMSGVIPPDAGEVHAFGRNITGWPSHRLAPLGVIRTFQLSRELGRLTCLENLMLAPLAQRGERLLPIFLQPGAVAREERALYAKACEVLEFARLADLRDEYAENLSGGQKKLLELARALMLDCELILLDEPGAGVNPALMKTLEEIIVTLNRDQGRTFLIVEHDMDIIARLCDPVIVMTEGRKLTEGPFDLVRRDPTVIEAYLGGVA